MLIAKRFDSGVNIGAFFTENSRISILGNNMANADAKIHIIAVNKRDFFNISSEELFVAWRCELFGNITIPIAAGRNKIILPVMEATE